MQAHIVRFVTGAGIVNVTLMVDYYTARCIAESTARTIGATSFSIHSLA